MKDIIDWQKDDCDKFWIDQGDSLFNNTPLRKNVADIVSNLKNMGHKIIIITARTTDLHKNPYKLSYDWLKRNNIPFDKLIVGQLDKTKACLDEKVDVFVDDRPENLINLQKYGIRTFLMETEPNKKQTIYNGEKVSNWNEIETLLK